MQAGDCERTDSTEKGAKGTLMLMIRARVVTRDKVSLNPSNYAREKNQRVARPNIATSITLNVTPLAASLRSPPAIQSRVGTSVGIVRLLRQRSSRQPSASHHPLHTTQTCCLLSGLQRTKSSPAAPCRTTERRNWARGREVD